MRIHTSHMEYIENGDGYALKLFEKIDEDEESIQLHRSYNRGNRQPVPENFNRRIKTHIQLQP